MRTIWVRHVAHTLQNWVLLLTDLDAAIWDNRSAFHIGLLDYEGLGERFGYRIVSIGEKPYHDPDSTSRAVALGIDDHEWKLEG